MGAAKLSSMPADLELEGNYTVRLTAIDPVTGAVVSGVNVSALAILIVNIAATLPPSPGFTITPLLVYEPGTA